MWIILLCAALFGADQWLKAKARSGQLSGSMLNGRIQLLHLENRGMAFGLSIEYPWLTRILPCQAMLAAFLSYLPGFPRKSTGERLGISLILLGGLSNILDRLRRHSVTDYIRFPRLPGRKLRTLVWNLADLMLLAGAFILALSEIRNRLSRKK